MSNNFVFFFDSNGRLHVTCDPGAPGAAAFGPTSASRRARPEEAGLVLQEGETAWAAARRTCRLIPQEEEVGWGHWYVLSDLTYRGVMHMHPHIRALADAFDDARERYQETITLSPACHPQGTKARVAADLRERRADRAVAADLDASRLRYMRGLRAADALQPSEVVKDILRMLASSTPRWSGFVSAMRSNLGILAAARARRRAK